MDFYDKNGTPLAIGDKIRPDEGRVLTLVSKAYVDEMGEEVMFGQQLDDDPMAFSLLTQDNLSKQWEKVE